METEDAATPMETEDKDKVRIHCTIDLTVILVSYFELTVLYGPAITRWSGDMF